MLTNYVRGGAILLLLMVAFSFLGSDHIAQSITPDIIVNTTSDAADFSGAQQVADLPGPDGLVSLREAIIAANNTAGPQLIAFNIPTGDPGFDGSAFNIRPLNQLPYITGDRTTIDGSTQTSFSGNTNAVGPEVVLDGSLLDLGTEPAGLHIRSADNYVHSLVVHSFWSGIENGGPSALRNVITGCFVGTDAAGVVARPNAIYGVTSRFGASHNRIGGPNLMDRNLISGNGVGVFVESTWFPGTTGNIIEGNLIGTDVTGTTGIGNREGIHIKCGVTDTLIVRNLIANNVQWGVLIDDLEYPDPSCSTFSVGNRISKNLMRGNGSEPIVLMPGGFSNDPGDADIGPNNLQNFPVLTHADATPGQLVVKGVIDTPNPNTVTIEFFANPVPIPGGDPSGRGEGAVFLGSTTPNASGNFWTTLPTVAAGTLITATATDAAGNTSEFAANIAAAASPASVLTALGPAGVWIGLKNSDDVGTKFDLLAEVRKNGVLIGSGQLNGIPGGSSGFNNAVLRATNLALSAPVDVYPGDTLGIRLSVRIAVGVAGHRSGTARLWFNDTAANSRFGATIGGTTNDYFLLNAFALGTAAGPGPKKTIDVFVDRAVGGNPFKPFGTWSKTF